VNIGIVGSRDYTPLSKVIDYVNTLPVSSCVVSGHAQGVDQTAEQAAQARGMRVISLPADWKKYGKSAGFKRNVDIVAHSDRIVAFWDGKSKGTVHTIRLAQHAGKPCEIIR
jgi:hypothetical protein